MLRYDGRTVLVVYVISAVVAGALLLLSVIGVEHGHDVGGELHHDADHGDGPWIPFFSLRFYTYFFASFGLAGLLLTFITKTDPTLTAWLSGGLGLTTGLIASFVIRILKGSETSGAANEKDMIGKEGEVLVPIRGASPGRIRCSVRGDIIDFLAVSESERALEPGETVIVVSMDNGRAQVVSSEGIFDELPAKVS